jgi:hypothetical protein
MQPMTKCQLKDTLSSLARGCFARGICCFFVLSCGNKTADRPLRYWIFVEQTASRRSEDDGNLIVDSIESTDLFIVRLDKLGW